jgi:transposase-like protein
MSIARRRWSPDEKAAIRRMIAEGYTYKQIGEKLRPGVPTAWRSIGEIVREEIKPNPLAPTTEGQAPAPSRSTIGVSSSHNSDLVELPESLQDSLTAREMMGMLDDEQRELFIGTYEDLMGESDDEQVTRAEKEMLLKASFAHVRYLRASRMIALCEQYLMMDLDGHLGDTDVDKAKKRLAGRGDAYKKEAELYHKEYMELLQSLKLTRAQRLDKIKDTRNTLLDLQAELTRRAKQESIVDEIKKINMATRDEFLRMSRGEVGPDGHVHPWLIGAFEELNPKDNKDG